MNKWQKRSPDGSHIAVTDWLGSNQSDIFIYSVTNSAFVQSVPVPEAIPKAESTGHCYLEAVKWLGDHQLQIRVFGHTDEARSHDFEYGFVFDLSSGRFAKAPKRAADQDILVNATTLETPPR